MFYIQKKYLVNSNTSSIYRIYEIANQYNQVLDFFMISQTRLKIKLRELLLG